MAININKMKALLEAKRVELRESLENLTEVYPPSGQPGGVSYDFPDFEEVAIDINEAVDEWSIRVNQESLLVEVEEALKRIEQGMYGRCVQCKQAIPEKRLEILPWAACDIKCQEQLEAKNKYTDAVGLGRVVRGQLR